MGDYFVLDNSVIMSLCFKDELNEHADRILDKLMVSIAVVPSIWPLEVVNVLVVAERMKRINRSDCLRFVKLIKELPIEIEQESPERVMNDIFFLAGEQKLSSYDASYLDLAIRLGLQFGTLDKKLKTAAKRLKIPLL